MFICHFRQSPIVYASLIIARRRIMTLHIGILVFPEVQQLDLTGPYEIFASTPDTQVHLLWKELGPIRSATGLPLTATATLADCPMLDVLMVPGGRGVNALFRDQEVIAFLRFQATQVRYLTAVCTGSLVLGAAGLLRGKRATTHWFSHDLLEKVGAHPVKQRVVREGTLFTAGGVTAGIDFALCIVAELCGERIAHEVQLALEYAPSPPFRSGEPETAPPGVVTAVTSRLLATRAEREAILAHAVGQF
jgi:cyclohexyl-isocyanide hydratase